MSWTEAAWTVKKIEQDLNIPIFINAYMAKLNELKELVQEIEERVPSQYDIDGVLETIAALQQSVARAKQEIRITVDNEQAFFDTARSIGQTNQFIPNNKNNDQIRTNTIWFVLDSVE